MIIKRESDGEKIEQTEWPELFLLFKSRDERCVHSITITDDHGISDTYTRQGLMEQFQVVGSETRGLSLVAQVEQNAMAEAYDAMQHGGITSYPF